MECPCCRQHTTRWVDTGRPDPENPGETISVLICVNCDWGIDALYTEED